MPFCQNPGISLSEVITSIEVENYKFCCLWWRISKTLSRSVKIFICNRWFNTKCSCDKTENRNFKTSPWILQTKKLQICSSCTWWRKWTRTFQSITGISSRWRGDYYKSCKNYLKVFVSRTSTVFWGLFTWKVKVSSKELLHLVPLFLNDNSPSSKTDRYTQKSLNWTYHSWFNSFCKEKATIRWNCLRHSKVNEPPMPIKIGLLIHATTRKKSLVYKFASDGP